MKSKCICCQSNEVIDLLDMGLQPPSNRFIKKQGSLSDTHPLVFGICKVCSHMQIKDPMDIDMVQSRFDWITYNEPEGHLDNVVSNFLKLVGFTTESKIIGITYKDDTVLDRLMNLGYKNSYRLNPETDFSVPNNAGLEVIQNVINTNSIQIISKKTGVADIVLARHILEHSHDPIEFINALKPLVKENGYLVFEVPDSERFMTTLDYPFLWEEHISYFIEESLRNFLAKQGLKLVDLYRYEYTFEDSLVVIAQVDNELQKLAIHNNVENAVNDLAHEFAKNYPIVKERVRNKIIEYIDAGKKVGLFGAGHLAVKYLNFFDLSDVLEMVIDDNPDKKGLYMPGSELPIVDSSNLEQLDLCLLSLSPESEEKVMNKYSSFLENGGEFKSIFASSPISLIDKPAS